MAITGTNRGSGGNTTSQTTWTITPGSDFDAYSTAVLCVAYDNAGAAGEDEIHGITVDPRITDSNGNFWYSVLNTINSSGSAANDGVVIRMFICYQEVETLTTADTISIFFNTSTAAKRWTLSQFATDNGTGIVYYIPRSGGTETGSGTSTTITTASITSGDAVMCMVGSEINDGTITADSDTTNGSWSTLQSSNGTGMSIYSQYKIVTATATQTYNLSGLTSGDYCEGYIILRESAYDLVGFGVFNEGGSKAATSIVTGWHSSTQKEGAPSGHGTIEPGSILVIFAYDSLLSGISDSVGNYYDRNISTANTNTSIYVSHISSALSNGSTITLNRSGTDTVIWDAIKVSSIRKKPLTCTFGPYQYASYNGDSTFDISSVPAGSMVVVDWLSITPNEDAEDTDTSNGIWSQMVDSYRYGIQYKVATATASQSHTYLTSGSTSSAVSRAAIIITPVTQVVVDPFGWYGVFGI